jgi:hypothetical protein
VQPGRVEIIQACAGLKGAGLERVDIVNAHGSPAWQALGVWPSRDRAGLRGGSLG